MHAADPTAPWQPLSVDGAAAVFAPLGIPWWVAGGWAVELFIGRPVRAHADIDIAVRRADTTKLAALRDRFELFIAHDGTLRAWDGGAVLDHEHQFWARCAGERAWAFEVLLEYGDGERWRYRRDARVTLPWSRFGIDVAGLPVVAPEVALLYKSNGPDLERNAVDFAAALPRLGAARRAWLRDALAAVAGGEHPWLAALAGASARAGRQV